MKNMNLKVRNLIRKYDTRDPEKIAKDLGIIVEHNPYSQKTKGLFIKAPKNKCIIVNSNLPIEEQRIVLAHELGHALLHCNRNTICIREFTLFPRGIQEREANKFAAELLIEDDVLSLYEGYTIEQIASFENVYKELLQLKFNLSIF